MKRPRFGWSPPKPPASQTGSSGLVVPRLVGSDQQASGAMPTSPHIDAAQSSPAPRMSSFNASEMGTEMGTVLFRDAFFCRLRDGDSLCLAPPRPPPDPLPERDCPLLTATFDPLVALRGEPQQPRPKRSPSLSRNRSIPFCEMGIVSFWDGTRGEQGARRARDSPFSGSGHLVPLPLDGTGTAFSSASLLDPGFTCSNPDAGSGLIRRWRCSEMGTVFVSHHPNRPRIRRLKETVPF